MSARKTIDALRAERDQLYAEIRRLQHLAGEQPTIEQMARDAKRGRIALAVGIPPLPGGLASSPTFGPSPAVRMHFNQAAVESLRLQMEDLGIDTKNPVVEKALSGTSVEWARSMEELSSAASLDNFRRQYMCVFEDTPVPDWTKAPPDATHALIKYPENVIWLKIGLDHELAQRWSWDRMAWTPTIFTGAHRKESKHVVARPEPDETWSITDETEGFTYDSLEELIIDNSGENRSCESFELVAGDTVHCGEKHYPDPARFIDADRVRIEIEEHMAENASANGFSEVADGYPKVSDEANAELETFLESWARKHCKPSFYNVRNEREYTVTAEDLEKAQ